LVKCGVTGSDGGLDAVATRSEDGKTLVLQVVNVMNKEVLAQIHLAGFVPAKSVAQAIELSATLEAVNTAANSDKIIPKQSQWQHGMELGMTTRVFPPCSFTILRFE
jgi:alpha-L-arabinofuranosidase